LFQVHVSVSVYACLLICSYVMYADVLQCL